MEVAQRIAVEDRIECRDELGRRRTVLRWRRQHDEGDGDVPRWVPVGPALFTLADASALIQVGGSTLQVVATGERLEVVDHDDAELPVLTDAVAPPALVAQQAAAGSFATGRAAWTR